MSAPSGRRPVRVLVVVHVFPPEHAPAGVMVRELAEDLACGGHEVTVLTGYPRRPAPAGGSGEALPRSARAPGGFRLLRCRHSTLARAGVASRIRYWLTFALSTFVRGLSAGPSDVVLCVSTPLFGTWSARALAALKGAGFVYAVFDVHPEAVANAGLIGARSPAYRLWRLQDTLLCHCSHAVVTLAEGLRAQLLARGVAAAAVRLTPFWLDPARIVPGERLNGWRRRHGIGDRAFVALYAGTVGHVSGARVLVDTARRLAGRGDILLLCVGEGEALPEVADAARASALENIRFLPFQPEEELSAMLAAADVGIVTLLPAAGATSVPSKVLGYLAAARPVLASVAAGCDTARLIDGSGCGVVVPPQDAEALARAIESAADDPAWVVAAGRRGREALQRSYSRQLGTARLGAVLAEVARGR